MTNNNLPTVSVIAPCRNEADFIEEAIKSILANDYPPELLEVLVIDGMSTDGTREIVKKLSQEDNRIKLLDNPQKIVPSAMNIGIKASKSHYIVRIDCHCEFNSDYISKCIEILQRTNAENVGGYMKTLSGDKSATAMAISSASSSIFGVGNSAFRIGGVECEADTVPFGTYRKELFDRIGLYDERLVRNQDIELNSRIRKNGGKIVISPEIKLSYYNRSTYTGIWQQSFNNGLWNPYTIWLVGGGLSIRHFIPMVFVLSLVFLTIGSWFFWPISILLAVDIILYSSVAAFFATRIAKENKVFGLRVFWAFIVLHIAYGIGSLWGIITIPFKFPNRKSSKKGTALADRK